MPFVIMGEGAATAWLKRQARLGAVQRLDLTLLIDTKDHGILRRREVNSDHVSELLHEFRIADSLKLLLRCGLS